MVDLNPATLFERLECCLVAELSCGVVFLVLWKDVAQIVVAVCVILVMTYGALVWEHRIIKLSKRSISDAEEEIDLGHLVSDSFIQDDVLTDLGSSRIKLLNVVEVLMLEN